MSAYQSMQHYQKTSQDLTRLLRSIFAFVLGFALSAWVCFANAALTGYEFDARCIPTQAEVLNAFRLKAQSIVMGNDYEICGSPYAPVIVANQSFTGTSAPMAIKYSVIVASGMPGNDLCQNATPRYLGIPPCDPDTQTLAFTGTNALFLVLGFFYAAMLGFKTGYRP